MEATIRAIEKDEACNKAMKLAHSFTTPAILKTAVELALLDILKNAGSSSDTFLSASELSARIGADEQNPEAHLLIDRILMFLASKEVVKCSLRMSRGSSTNGVERVYSLGEVGEFFVKNEDGVSMGAPIALMNLDKGFVETWYHLKDAILEGGNTFNRAHGGASGFEYAAKDSRFNEVLNQAMSQNSNIIMKRILETYKGFEGLKSLVDVGGNVGTSLHLITSKYPSIKGINFDLPHVIRHAPNYPGVEHVGGDMFVSVPKADAIFMKWVCHDWGDEQCLKLLRNCHMSLPEKGKVIVAEHIFSEEPNDSEATELSSTLDMVMLAYNPSGKERTERNFAN